MDFLLEFVEVFLYGIHMKETWKRAVGFPAYSVSDRGRVRNDVARQGTFAGRILRPYSAGQYPGVSLFRGGGSRAEKHYVHRLVTEAFLGPCPEGKEVNHKDGDKWNPCLSNLEYLTRGENQRHAYRTGLKSAKGQKAGSVKLTEVEVRQIRHRYANGESQRELAVNFGMTRPAIQQIVTGRSWPHVGGSVKRKRVSKYAPATVKASCEPE